MIYSIGYSLRSKEEVKRLIGLRSKIVCDVRSNRISRFNKDFGVSKVNEWGEGWDYFWLKDLGGKEFFNKGGYDGIIKEEGFLSGIDCVMKMKDVVLLCVEKDVLKCHRFYLIGRYLKERRGIDVVHLGANEKGVKQSELEELMRQKDREKGGRLWGGGLSDIYERHVLSVS